MFQVGCRFGSGFIVPKTCAISSGVRMLACRPHVPRMRERGGRLPMSFCLPSPLYFGEKGVMLCLYRLLPVVKAGENVLFSCHPPGLDVTINRSVPESQTVLHPAFLRSPCMLTIPKRNDAG